MGYFGNLTYADSSKRKFVGLPLNTLLEVGKNLQARYDAAEEGMNQYKLLESSLNIENPDRITLKNLIQEAQSKFNPFIQAGNLWDMGSIVKQEATRLITDPRIKASIEDKQIRSTFENDILKSEEYNLGTKNYAIAQSGSMVKMKEVDPITGVVTNRYSTPSIIKDIDQTKIGENIVKLLKDNPSAITNKTLRDARNHYLAYGNLEGITAEQLSTAYNAYIDAMPNSELYKKQLANVALFNSRLAEFNDGELEYKASSISEYYNIFGSNIPTTNEEALLNPLLLQSGLVKVENNLDENGAVIQKSNIKGGIKGINYSWDDAALKELGIESEDLYNNIHEFNTNITEKIGNLLANIELGKGAKYASTFAFVKDNSTLYQNHASIEALKFAYAKKLEDYKNPTMPGMEISVPGQHIAYGEGDHFLYNTQNIFGKYYAKANNQKVFNFLETHGSLPDLKFNDDKEGTVNIEASGLNHLSKYEIEFIQNNIRAGNWNNYKEEAYLMQNELNLQISAFESYFKTKEGKLELENIKILTPGFDRLNNRDLIKTMITQKSNASWIHRNFNPNIAPNSPEARAELVLGYINKNALENYKYDNPLYHISKFLSNVSKHANKNKIQVATPFSYVTSTPVTYNEMIQHLNTNSDSYNLLGGDGRTYTDFINEAPSSWFTHKTAGIDYQRGLMKVTATLNEKVPEDIRKKYEGKETITTIIVAPSLINQSQDRILQESLSKTPIGDALGRHLYTTVPMYTKDYNDTRLFPDEASRATYKYGQTKRAYDLLIPGVFSKAVNDIQLSGKNKYSLSMISNKNNIIDLDFDIIPVLNKDESQTGSREIRINAEKLLNLGLITEDEFKLIEEKPLMTISNKLDTQTAHDIVQHSANTMFKFLHDDDSYPF